MRGFLLIETLISIFILFVVVGGLFSVVANTKRNIPTFQKLKQLNLQASLQNLKEVNLKKRVDIDTVKKFMQKKLIIKRITIYNKTLHTYFYEVTLQ
ncbi:MAG: hypothetical protein GXO40_06240 [Epsilonproteobacteria bacterium]|nr:hypothetical protein [Campylobacterota bacterium]